MSKPGVDINYNLDHALRVRSDDPIWHLHEYDVDLKSNHIYLMGVDRGYDVTDGLGEPGIEYVIAKRFIKNLNLCMRVNKNRPIIIHQKTNGGYWEEGMAIYDAIKSCPSQVTILNYTHARSMSSIIFQAADKRVMMPHSHFMFHDGTFEVSGTVKQVRSTVKFDTLNTKTMLDIYARKMQENGKFKSKPLLSITKWLKAEMARHEDVFLTATQTVEYGLADEIFNYDWKSLTKY